MVTPVEGATVHCHEVGAPLDPSVKFFAVPEQTGEAKLNAEVGATGVELQTVLLELVRLLR